YDFYFLTGDLENGPDKGVIQYAQTSVVIGKGAVTPIPASDSIHFNAGGTVSGTVTSSYSTHPLAGAMVYLSADQTGQITRAWGSTDANGQIQFDHVPAGTYYLILSYPGYNFFTPITITVTEGGTLTVPGTSTVMTPIETPGTISGNLTPFGTGIDSRILLKQGETVIANVAPSTTDGSYSISDVVPGSYTLIGSARGYTPGQVSVGVTAGQTLTQNFTLNDTKSVIVNGLNWLLAHQRADGSFDDNLSGDADQFVFGWTGYTGLTLLAVLENPKYNVSANPDYLGATLLGQIHEALYGVTGTTPKNGIKQYFESTYRATGDDIGAFYSDNIAWASVAATPVALEKLIALGMPLNDPKVTGAVQFLLGAQITVAKASNPIFAGGWRYNPYNTDTDNWETAWVIMALMKAGVNPSVQAVVDGLAHIRRSQITEGGGAGLFAYQPNDTSGYGPLGTSAACVLALNFAGAPNSDPDVNRFFQWVKNNGGFSGYDRWADAYWWSMFPWAAVLYDDPATSGKKYYETLKLTWNMADDIVLRQNSNGSWSNPNYITGGSNSGNTVMYTASALMAIAPYAGLTPLPDEATIAGTVRNPAGAGLQNAKVEALLDGIVRASVVTSEGGAFTLNVPQNYSYTLRVTAAGYVRKSVTTANIGTGGLTVQDIAYLANDVDTAHPTISGLTPANGSTVAGGMPVISAVLVDLGSDGNAPSGIDPATISMNLDGNAVNASYDASTGVVSFTPPYDLSNATHTVTVDVNDFAGNPAVQASWSFTTVAPTISFDGKVTDKDGNAIVGATIEALGVTGVSSVASRDDGTFTLTGIPAGQDFHLWITPPTSLTGYLPTYSSISNSSGSFNRVGRPFILRTGAEVSGWG
ncbi:MAG: carboxypeptidase regulatory-like domain-containing protein, partial [Planctomycetota bacterium]